MLHEQETCSDGSKERRMFKTRLISGIILVAAAILLININGIPLIIVLCGLSIIGMEEFYRATGIISTADLKDLKNSLNPLAITGLAGAVFWYVLLALGAEKFYVAGIVCVLLVIMGIYVFSWPKIKAEEAIFSFFPLIYVAVMLSFIYLTRNTGTGRIVVWLIFLSSWGCDTCAYCVGMLIGKHKMAPKLSPKKSIEGAVGGVIGAALLGIIFALIFKQPMLEYAIICAIGALISMVGDLAASAIKRNMDIKDYGNLIPGHGGVLDRFDSVIFTAPVIYLLALLLIC